MAEHKKNVVKETLIANREKISTILLLIEMVLYSLHWLNYYFSFK